MSSQDSSKLIRFPESAVRGLTPVNPETTLHVDGGFNHPPMEPVERNQALWRLAHETGRRLGLDLEQTAVGRSFGREHHEPVHGDSRWFGRLETVRTPPTNR